MSIRKLAKGDETSLEKYLSQYAETSMFLRSNLRASGIDYVDKRFHGEYIASFNRSGEINGVIAHYWNGNIMTQTIDDAVLNQLICAFRENVSRPIAGILGPSQQSELIISRLGLLAADFIINRDEALYALDLHSLKLATKLESHRYRMLDVQQLEKSVLFEWIKAYEIEAIRSEDNDALDPQLKKRVDEINRGKNCWVLMVDNVPVSLSGFNARLADIVQIGPVWTPPKYRNKGYARTLLALTLNKARKEDIQRAILFTDNPAAIKSYESIGFKKIGIYRLALLRSPLELNETNQE